MSVVPDATIHITDGLPLDDLRAARQLYENQGCDLCDVLYHSLPGGTFDALLRHMLEKRASLLAVPLSGDDE